MVRKLFELALRAVQPISFASLGHKEMEQGRNLNTLGGEILEEAMESFHARGDTWDESWNILLTPRITRLIIPWDVSLFKKIGENCRSLETILITSNDFKFTAIQLRHLPRNVHTIDTVGLLYYGGRTLPQPKGDVRWLDDVDFWIRSITCIHLKHPVIQFPGLCRLDFSRITISSSELMDLLRTYPGITLLRHYQLVTALCQLHMEKWRIAPATLPVYNLTNIDADFSHVVRCRMSPKAVLPPEALRLAVTLCPHATSVRIRFDTSTPHHVVSYLTSLKVLNDFSAVCVSSGERVLLDFQDFMPVLEHFGTTSLKSLELKVVEEVEPHFILRSCPRLEHLTLSGCGFTQTCRGPRCRPGPSLSSLLTFYYADGDDFSWDHTLPQCFWISVFGNSRKRGSKLEGLFLESPRISEETLTILLGSECSFQYLRVACIRRSPELNRTKIMDLVRASPNLSYLRVEGFGPGAAATTKRQHPKITIKLD